MASTEHKKKRHGGLIVLALFVLVSIAAGLFVYSKYTGYRDFNEAYDPADTELREFHVERGEGYNTIAKHLQDAGLIEDAEIFSNKTKILKIGPKYQAGDFLLSPSMTMEEIMTSLQDGKRNTVRFTIPEGYTLAQTAQKLASEGLVDEQAFYKALEDYDQSKYWFLEDLKADQPDPTNAASAEANKYEGFLFPNTYEIYEGSTEKMIIDKLFAQFDKVFDEDLKKLMQERGQNVKEIVTIASIIEREAREDEERALVASVIYNRLDIDMLLQIDATIQYAQGYIKEGLLYSDLEIESPYNSYKYKGLPPGPICSPGEASIRAALEPADTDYLYYVLKSKSSTTHNFAETYSQFEKYKAQFKNSK